MSEEKGVTQQESISEALRQAKNKAAWTVQQDKKKTKKEKKPDITSGTATDKSQKVARDVDAFLKSGGKIEEVPTGISGVAVTGNMRVGIVISGKKDANQPIYISKKKED